MAKIKRYTEGGYHNELCFMCPGCKTRHFIHDCETTNPDVLNENPRMHIWTFNGDFDNPTIRDSVLVRHYDFNPNSENHDIEVRCHSFITNGMIEFLPDCQHALANQTVELPTI